MIRSFNKYLNKSMAISNIWKMIFQCGYDQYSYDSTLSEV